jgi:hypothetical protein
MVLRNNKCLYGYTCVNLFVLIACATVVYIYTGEIKSHLSNKTNTDFMNQVADDWKQIPYTNLTITSGSSCPSTHPHAVYDRVWNGMKHGCNCLDIYS